MLGAVVVFVGKFDEEADELKEHDLVEKSGFVARGPSKVDEVRFDGAVWPFPLAQRVSAVVVTLGDAGLLLDGDVLDLSTNGVCDVKARDPTDGARLWCPKMRGDNGGVVVWANKAESRSNEIRHAVPKVEASCGVDDGSMHVDFTRKVFNLVVRVGKDGRALHDDAGPRFRRNGPAHAADAIICHVEARHERCLVGIWHRKNGAAVNLNLDDSFVSL